MSVTEESCDNKELDVVFVVVYSIVFLIFVMSAFYFTQDEVGNVPPKSENIPEFYPTVHQIAVASFTFFLQNFPFSSLTE